eukprot:3703880-Pyramimonas_sp.AAC.1
MVSAACCPGVGNSELCARVESRIINNTTTWWRGNKSEPCMVTDGRSRVTRVTRASARRFLYCPQCSGRHVSLETNVGLLTVTVWPLK